MNLNNKYSMPKSIDKYNILMENYDEETEVL